MTVEALRSVPLFASLGDDDARALRRLLKPRALKRGDVLFRQGDAGNAMYLIGEGRVAIYITDEDGQQVTLAELARGDFFGEMALIEGKPRTACARALEATRLASLSRDDFIAFVRLNPGVALAMLGALSDRLRATDELLRRRVSRNVNEIEQEQMTVADRLADTVSGFSGSWFFIALTVIYITSWVIFLRHGLLPFSLTDGMGFLDAINGCIAALLTPIILISQNRQEKKDRLRSDMDFRINLKNELALTEVLRRLDVLESERLPGLFAEQNARLHATAKPAPPDGEQPTI
jgi:CRP-like cAMP-binding protein